MLRAGSWRQKLALMFDDVSNLRKTDLHLTLTLTLNRTLSSPNHNPSSRAVAKEGEGCTRKLSAPSPVLGLSD